MWSHSRNRRLRQQIRLFLLRRLLSVRGNGHRLRSLSYRSMSHTQRAADHLDQVCPANQTLYVENEQAETQRKSSSNSVLRSEGEVIFTAVKLGSAHSLRPDHQLTHAL